MVARKGGGVLFFSYGLTGLPGPYRANSAATSAYIFSLAASLHGELRRKGVDVSVLSHLLEKESLSRKAEIHKSGIETIKKTAEGAAEVALSKLGRRFHIVPGLRNKMLTTLTRHRRPGQYSGKMEQKNRQSFTTNTV